MARSMVITEKNGRWDVQFILPDGSFITPMDIKRVKQTLNIKFLEMVRSNRKVTLGKLLNQNNPPAVLAGAEANVDEKR